MTSSTERHGHPDGMGWALGALSLAFAVGLAWHLQGPWLRSGEMWAEMGKNYFLNAHAADWSARLLATDAGYFPLPPRLIALVSALVGVTAAWTPYVYNAAAVALMACATSLFCLPFFRPLLANDVLRFLACLLLVATIDFETKTFVNFSYIGAWVIAIVSLRLCAEPVAKLSLWVWVLPLLLMSKPAVMAALPLAVLAAWRSRGMYRAVTVVMVAAALAQLWQIKLSRDVGVMPLQSSGATLGSMLHATLGYGFGYLGEVLIGPMQTAMLASKHRNAVPWTGFILGILVLVVAKIRQGPARVLIIGGGALLFSNMLINCVALSADWNADFARLANPYMYRHVVVAYWGGLLIVLGLLSTPARWGGIGRAAAVAVFAIWAYCSGWLMSGIASQSPPDRPILGSSQWQRHVDEIDDGKSPLCIPMDPFAWGIYGRDCDLLNKESHLAGPWGFETVETTPYRIAVPQSVVGQEPLAIAFMVRRSQGGPVQVQAEARLVAPGVADRWFRGSARVDEKGISIMLSPVDPSGHAAAAGGELEVRFTPAIQLFFMQQAGQARPAVMWMGRPAGSGALAPARVSG